MESFPQPQAEKIKAAAIRMGGEIFTGPVHAVARNKAREALADFQLLKDLAEEGFVTTTGRFVSREEAGEIADRAAQLGHLEDELYDEARKKLDSHDIEESEKFEEDFKV